MPDPRRPASDARPVALTVVDRGVVGKEAIVTLLATGPERIVERTLVLLDALDPVA